MYIFEKAKAKKRRIRSIKQKTEHNQRNFESFHKFIIFIFFVRIFKQQIDLREYACSTKRALHNDDCIDYGYVFSHIFYFCSGKFETTMKTDNQIFINIQMSITDTKFGFWLISPQESGALYLRNNKVWVVEYTIEISWR